MDDRQSELHNLSNQFIDVYVKDIFAKNEQDLNRLKARLTDEQKENIRNSIDMLKTQVDEFLDKQNTRKRVTEDSDEVQPNVSPLRAKVLGEGQKKNDRNSET